MWRFSVFDGLIFDCFDYLPSFFFAGSADVAGEAVGWATGAIGCATDALGCATTGAACTTGAGVATSTFGSTIGWGVRDRLRSRCSLTSADGVSIVCWIFFKILSNESWPEWKERKHD